MIAIISDNEQENIGKRLYDYLIQSGEAVSFIPASNKNIKPCYSCGGCERQTLGRCVVRDDMDEILPVLARATTYIYTSPVVWGGITYPLKKVLDKSALLGNRFYRVRNGELVKGINVDVQKLFLIGVCEGQEKKEATDFVFWGKEVIKIMDVSGNALTVSGQLSEEELQKLGKELIAK